jgi:hypothetical protein
MKLLIMKIKIKKNHFKFLWMHLEKGKAQTFKTIMVSFNRDIKNSKNLLHVFWIFKKNLLKPLMKHNFLENS